MSSSEMFSTNSAPSHSKAAGQAPHRSTPAKSLECFIATGFGSRGGPNKVTNKLRRTLNSYVFF